jgi:hypothetical protein
MNGRGRGKIAYAFAVLRAVPHVHLGTFANVGVVLHARTEEYLGLRVILDEGMLRRRVAGADTELLARYLRSCVAICAGNPEAGPVALAPPSERFHWLTAPRSDVLQSSPVHEGVCDDASATLDELYTELVGE